MPGFVIPNAPQTGTAAYYGYDQAEPDTLDFSILGNRKTGVISGGQVTAPLVAAATVNVSALTAIINGVTVTTAAVSALSVGAANGAADRFDLVVARLSGTTATITVITGTADSTNPVLPPTTDYLAAIGNTSTAASQRVDLSTDLVLAAIFRPSGDSNVVSKLIADKRVFVSNLVLSGSGAPASTLGVAGDIYADTSAGDPAAGGSKLYVKETTSGWRNIGSFAVESTSVPIGTVIAWAGITPPDPSTYKPLNGQTLSKSTYSTLYSIFKGNQATALYGETTSEFTLPNYNNAAFLKGGTTPSATTSGGNTVTLTTANLPQHSHSMQSHTHGMTHAHTLSNHSHTVSGSISGGIHSHNVQTGRDVSGIYESGFVTQVTGTGAGGQYIGLQTVATGFPNAVYTTSPYLGQAQERAYATGQGSFHSHDFSLTAAATNADTGQYTGTTGGPSQGNTGDAGSASPTAINTAPFHYTCTWYIKVL